jgi:hypothetical protein
MDVNLFDVEQFSLVKEKKRQGLFFHLSQLHAFHYNHSDDYKNVSDVLFKKDVTCLEDIPFLPVSIFKNRELRSIPTENVFKVLTSSGTTGSVPSRIFLDKDTAKQQTLALSKIMTHVIGKERLPMLIVDSKSILKNRKSFSARGAGILGLSVFGKKHHYLLNDNFEVDEGILNQFIEKFNGQKILIFGFTFMVWKYLFLKEKTKHLDLSNAILIHSGGWKKLQDMAVDNSVFKKELKEKFKLQKVYNFYGMVEQVGSVYLENEKGYLHCPNFSDIIIRNPVDFSVQPHGKPGLIQVISTLPKSYPGHSILTEDIGVCMGEDDLSWKGKYFKILGRAKKAELRGCSDTFAVSRKN